MRRVLMAVCVVGWAVSPLLAEGPPGNPADVATATASLAVVSEGVAPPPVIEDGDADGIAGMSTPEVDPAELAVDGSGPGAAAADIIAVSWAGNRSYHLDSSPCTGVLLGPSGASVLNGMARSGSGVFYTAGSGNRLWTINPNTGVATFLVNIGINSVRGLARSSNNNIPYAIQDGSPDELYTVDTGGVTVLKGPTGVTSIQGLAMAPDGTLYAWDISKGLMTVDKTTGLATDVDPGVGGRDMQALDFAPDGTLYGGRHELYTIDTGTGLWALCGSGGYNDVRGFAFFGGGQREKCVYKTAKIKQRKCRESGCPFKQVGCEFKTDKDCEKVKDCKRKLKFKSKCANPNERGSCKHIMKRCDCR